MILLGAFAVMVAAAPPLEEVPFTPARWKVEAKESRFEQHLGRPSLFLAEGIAWVEGSELTDGILEVDMAFSRERGFHGLVWRVQDPENYEELYLRPHQSGNPDANQYTPVFNGMASWQLYYGEGYSAPVEYPFDQWITVRVVVSGQEAEVYIGDLSKPAFFIPELKREIASGRVGVETGAFSPAYFSNFRFAARERPVLQGKAPPRQPAPSGTIMAWSVSSPFGERSLDGRLRLDAQSDRSLAWTRLGCERSGLANLARIARFEEGRDTVFARVTITAAEAGMKKLRFGFSDRVKVYLNGRLLFEGDDAYRSRDYRFLGTIGYFDTLYLPLEKGDNELRLAVSEEFGGWGLLAMFDDPGGIKVHE